MGDHKALRFTAAGAGGNYCALAAVGDNLDCLFLVQI